MLNVNSPTVQAMLGNIPQGYGNMPVYFGNTPTIEPAVVQPPVSSPANNQIPFPSPKEMLMQGGQQTIYNQTGFAPRNIVGAYNPGYQAAFTGYSNPYMGAYAYPGFNNYFQVPMDQDAQDRLEAATLNGISYDEQLKEESNLYKNISRIVSKSIGRSEEKTKECAAAFDIYCKYPQEETIEKRKIKPLHVQLKIGDKVISDIKTEATTISQSYYRNTIFVEQMKYRQHLNEMQRIARCNQLYERAPERMFDNVNLLEFFNDCAGVLMADTLSRELYNQSIKRTSQAYNKDEFRKRLLENNGLKTREQTNALDRFVGRYGFMPDGRPVSPAHDPAVASSFSYDPKTGQYNVTAPNFIRDRLERARESFIRSIDE